MKSRLQTLIILVTAIGSISCVDRPKVYDEEPLLVTLDSLAQEFIHEHRIEHNPNREIYYNVQGLKIQGLPSVIYFTITVGSRPLETGSMPFRFRRFGENKEDVVFYSHFDDIEFDSKEMLSKLAGEELIIPLRKDGSIPPPDPDFDNGWKGWGVVFCKSDLSKFLVIKGTYYVLTKKDVPASFTCRD